MLNVTATQELHRRLEVRAAQIAEIESQAARIEALEKQSLRMAALLERLDGAPAAR
ncbi:MAG: hypothetical protein ABL931_14020 [Usitatibacteraceae bacterium]